MSKINNINISKRKSLTVFILTSVAISGGYITSDITNSNNLFGLEVKAETTQDITFGVTQDNKADVVLTVGDTLMNTTNFGADLKAKLASKGISTNLLTINSVETSASNLQSSFNWVNEVTSSVGSINFQNNGTTIQMYGNTRNAGANRIYMNNTNENIKSQEFGFTYNLDYGDNFDGAGVLFNTNVNESGQLNGYLLYLPNASQGTAQIYKLTNWLKGDQIVGGGSGSASLVGSLSMGKTGSFKMKMEKNKLTVTNTGTNSVVGSVTLPTHYGWGLGFYSDHYSHACDNIGQFALSNISLNTTTAKNFRDIIKEPTWQDGTKRFVINVDDNLINDFDNSQALGEILPRLLTDEIYYVGLGTSSNQTQANNFIAKNNNNGAFYTNTNYANAVENSATYIYNVLKSKSGEDDQYVLMGEETTINVNPSNLKTNTQTAEYPNGRWKIKHDYEYFDNNLGQAQWADQYQKDLQVVFDKPGRYEVLFEDNPINPRYVYVHRKPVANFSANLVKSGTTYTVNLQDSSYDLDLESQSDRGIKEYEWKWKKTTDSTWTTGKPTSLASSGEYIVQLRVKDYQGEWSAPQARYLSTSNVVTKPVADFNIGKSTISKYEDAVIQNTSYSPSGNSISEYKWEVKKGGTTIYTSSTAPKTNYLSNGTGTYQITLSVKDSNGIWSDTFTRSLTVTEDTDKPESIVNPVSRSLGNTDIGVNITYKDSGGSGFKRQRYVVSKSLTPPGTSDSNWSSWSTSTSQTVNIKTDGVYYIHLEAEDVAGNKLTRTLGTYELDKTSPVLTVDKNTESPTNKDVTLNVVASDENGIEFVRYLEGDVSEKDVIENGIAVSNGKITVTSNKKITVVTRDKAGNTTKVVKEITNIDKEAPKITFSYDDRPTNKDVLPVKVLVEDNYTTDLIKEYKLANETDYGEWKQFTGDTIDVVDNVELRVRVTDTAGNIGEESTIIGNIDRIAPEPPKVQVTESEKTNQDVIVTPEFSEDSSVYEYSLDKKTWETYTTPLKVTQNRTLYFRSADDAGNFSEIVDYDVNNIDKEPPMMPIIILNDYAPTNKDVYAVLGFSGDSEIKEYSIDKGVTWLEYTGKVKFSGNGEIWARATDSVGNISLIAKETITNIDKVAPTDPIVSQDVTIPTNKSVKVSVEYSIDSEYKEYSFNNRDWYTYDGEITIDDNTSIYFRGQDDAGNYSKTVKYDVTNIDKIAPTTPIGSVDNSEDTNKNVILSLTFSRDTFKRYYSLDNGNTWLEYNTSLIIENNSTILAKGEDFAGNMSDVLTYKITNIDKEPPIKPTVKLSTTKPTNEDVKLVVEASEDTKEIEYSINGGTTWVKYTGNDFITGNTEVLVRGKDKVGNISDIERINVTNIDKESPNDPSISQDITRPINTNVLVEAKYSDDTLNKEYSYDKENWVPYTGKLDISENKTIYFRGQDEAGNYTNIVEYIIGNIDKEAPNKPVGEQSNSNPTNKDVKVTITYSSDSKVKEYSLDGGKNWSEYTGDVNFTKNGKLLARGQDEAGNYSETLEYEVTNIDKEPPTDPKVTANTKNPTNKNVLLTAEYSSDSKVKEYSIDGNDWVKYENAVEVTENTTVYFRGQDESGNYTNVVSYKVTNIDKETPDKPKLTISETSPTNKDVVIAVTYSGDSELKKYSYDGEIWYNYTGEIVISENKEIYFKGIDDASNESEVVTYKVTNIDKTAPNAPVVTSSNEKPTNQSIKLSAEYSEDTEDKYYSIDNENWVRYSKEITVNNNGTYYFKGVDNAGNESDVVKYVVTNIDKEKPENPKVTISNSNPTNKNVTLIATYSEDSDKKYYSLDGTSWLDYEGEIEVDENKVVYFQSVDDAGNMTDIVTYNVNNIDKEPPSAPKVTSNITKPTNTDVLVNAEYSEDSIIKQYSKDLLDWFDYTEPIVFIQNGVIYFKGYDDAGNVSNISKHEVTNIDKEAPGNPTYKLSTIKPTNEDVIITILNRELDGTIVYTDNTGEHEINGDTIVVKDNQTIQVKSKDSVGNISGAVEIAVSNIDREPPEDPILTYDKSPTNKNVDIQVKLGDSKDRVFYKEVTKSRSDKWLELDSGTLTVTENKTIAFKALDEAGNYSNEVVADISNIDRDAPEIPNEPVIADVPNNIPTNTDVNLTVKDVDDTKVYYKELGTSEWKLYTDHVTVDKNSTYMFKYKDSAGNDSDVFTYTVSNIDKENPVEPKISYNDSPTNKDVELTVTKTDSKDRVYYSYDGRDYYELEGNKLIVSTNSEITFKSVDEAKNESNLVKVNITNIDRDAPKVPIDSVTASISNSTPTNKDVVLTVKDLEDSRTYGRVSGTDNWKDITGEKITVTDNTSYEFKYIDEAGNDSEIFTYTVTNIDKVAPSVPTVDYNTKPTNKDIVVTVGKKDAKDEIYYKIGTGDWIKLDGKEIVIKDNVKLELKTLDEAGNYSELTIIDITNIDREPTKIPTETEDGKEHGVISYSDKNPTNKDVVITIDSIPGNDIYYREKGTDEWIKLEGNEIITDKNVEYEFKYVDEAGNDSEIINVVVDNINKVPPKLPIGDNGSTEGETESNGKEHGVISYSDKNPTNKDVTITIDSIEGTEIYYREKGTDEWIKLEGNEITTDKNIEYEIKYVDIYGNDSEIINVVVDNINKVPPKLPIGDIGNGNGVDGDGANGKESGVISYSDKNPTNKDVIITIDSIEGTEIFYREKGTDEWTKLEGNQVVVDKNKELEFKYVDIYGNDSDIISVNVDNIDKTPPQIPTNTGGIIKPNIVNPTNQNVEISVGAIELNTLAYYREKGSNDWILLGNSGKIIATSNKTYEIKYVDGVGNDSEIIEYAVKNIDKTPPTEPTVTSNNIEPTIGYILLTSTYSVDSYKKEYRINGGDWKAYTGTLRIDTNGEVEFRGQDIAGNYSQVTKYYVSNIHNKQPNNPIITVNTEQVTNKNVKVTGEFSEDTVTKYYRIDGGEWIEYTGEIELDKNSVIEMKGENIAGLSSGITTKTISNIDKEPPSEPKIKVIKKDGYTIVKVDYGENVSERKYAIIKNDASIEWLDATGDMVFEDNTIIAVQSFDEAGNASKIITKEIKVKVKETINDVNDVDDSEKGTGSVTEDGSKNSTGSKDDSKVDLDNLLSGGSGINNGDTTNNNKDENKSVSGKTNTNQLGGNDTSYSNLAEDNIVYGESETTVDYTNNDDYISENNYSNDTTSREVGNTSSSTNSNSSSSSTNDENLPQTGEQSGVATGLGIGALLSSIVLFLRRKKNK